MPGNGSRPAAEPYRLLLVEDDHDLAKLLLGTLTQQGYALDIARDGQRALHLGLTRRYDVLVIDCHLPAPEGLDLLVRLRSRDVPARALLLGAQATARDRVAGLDAGADDYLVKPFDLEELHARLRALCRRALDTTDALRIGTARLDPRLREVVHADGHRVALSAREFELLRVLAARPTVVRSRADLRRLVFHETPAASIVDTYVYYLRRKLGRSVVDTVHGLGYRVGTL